MHHTVTNERVERDLAPVDHYVRVQLSDLPWAWRPLGEIALEPPGVQVNELERVFEREVWELPSGVRNFGACR